jgi:hypothetical protein
MIIPLRSTPGVQRDGTRFDRNYYLDGQWCRFQRGLPRKMGGYRSVVEDMTEIVYGINSFTVNALQYMHLGSASLLIQRLINNAGVQTTFNDRTPGAFVANADNVWQFDAIFDVSIAGGSTVIVAHGAPNLANIASDDAQPVWYGELTAATPLIDTTYTPVSGGIITVGNYLVAFGSGGYVQWNSTANNLAAGQDEDFITPQKIVKGLVVRGGGVPAALLWSLDSLLIMTLNAGGTPIWDFDTIGESSILSSRGVIEYDGIYYWPGVDRFLAYNGVLREIPNQYNFNYFFDGLNFAQRQKVFAYKVPRYGEIWWCYPRGSATECTHAVVFNVRENYWYDTELPNSGRSDGLYAKVYFKPFMTGIEEGTTGFTLWQHETGVDQVNSAGTEPVPSHFETAEISIIGADKPEEGVLRVAEIETDFVQTGDLTLTVKGRANARAAVDEGAPQTITEQQEPPAGVDAENQMVRVKDAKRLMSFRIASNTPGGDYQMGKSLAHVDKSGERKTQ